MLSSLKAKEFGRKGGRASALKQVRRSKDEIRLFELCRTYFDGVEHNKTIVDGWDADISVPCLKLAIFWNGPWHYKEMDMSNHHLLQVQTRDKIKIDVLSRNGWMIRVFEDRHYTPESAFAELVAEESARRGSNPELAGYEPEAIPI